MPVNNPSQFFVKAAVFFFLPLFVLAGCQGSQTNGSKFKNLSASVSPVIPAFSDIPSQSVLESADVSNISLKSPTMESYLQLILGKLLRHWGGDDYPKIGVFLTAENAFNASATPFNDILIPIHVIEKVKNEDELAAILAHELGHILLRHFEDEKNARVFAKIAGVAATAYAVVSIAQKMDVERIGTTTRLFIPDSKQAAAGGDILKATLAFSGAVTLVSDIGVSAFTRYQEYEADRFAIELLSYAKYDPAAILQVLEYVRTSVEEGKKKKKKLEIYAQSFEGAIFTVLQNALKEISATLTKKHPDPAKRLKKARKRLREIVGENPIPKRSVALLQEQKTKVNYRNLADFYNKFYHYLSQSTQTSTNALINLLNSRYGKTALARSLAYTNIAAMDSDIGYKLLTTATDTNRAPIIYYPLLSSAQVRNMDAKAAIATINNMAGRFGWSATLPTAIGVANSLRDEAWKIELLERCANEVDKKIRKNCDNAAGSIKSDSIFRKIPGFFSSLLNS